MKKSRGPGAMRERRKPRMRACKNISPQDRKGYFPLYLLHPDSSARKAKSMLPASLHDSPWRKGSCLSDRIPVPAYCLDLLDAGVPFGVWVCDLAGGVCYLSPSFLEAVGMGLEQCRGEGWSAVLPAEELESTVEKWRSCVREARPWCHEFHIRGRDGKLRSVLGRGAPVTDGAGRMVAWAGVNLDLTDQRQEAELARRREERRRMAQRLDVIGRLAGGVAHDFNNLLTAINGYSELLISTLEDQADKAAYAREILKAGEKAAHLTRQLLAFSRRQIFAPKIIDLNGVLKESTHAIAALVGTNVAISLQTGAERARIKADPAQVEQVILNLAVNAKDAMPNGGTLTFQTYDAELDAEDAEGEAEADRQRGRYVVLLVQDTGTGMDESVLSHLFEPFYTTKDRGQGLGLPAVYGILKQNGGHIAVTSRPGDGTEVRVYWPLWEGGEQEGAVSAFSSWADAGDASRAAARPS
jgi:two-component system cell cycle sensor histidine kinase/response regulator CckA